MESQHQDIPSDEEDLHTPPEQHQATIAYDPVSDFLFAQIPSIWRSFGQPFGHISQYWKPKIEDMNSGGIYPEGKFLDQRATRNPACRRNITRTNNRSRKKVVNHRVGKGRYHDEMIEDPEDSGTFYSIKEYENMAVRESLRQHAGHNIHPRHKQKNQYKYGYKTNGEFDNFIVSSEEEDILPKKRARRESSIMTRSKRKKLAKQAVELSDDEWEIDEDFNADEF